MPSGVYIRTEQTRKNISESLKGREGVKSMLGKHHTAEWKKAMSERVKGHKYNVGKRRSEEWKIAASKRMAGEGNPRYIKDRSKLLKKQERNDPAYKEWRKNVWQRDRFMCKMKNNECNGRVEAHHIFSWRDNPELRYLVTNGITLCHAHHPRVRSEEKRLIPIFQELVSVSK